MRLHHSSKFDRQASRQGRRIATFSLLLIAGYSLFPFQLSNQGQWSWQWFVAQFSRDELSDWKDLVEWFINLLVYSMLSYGLTGLLQRHRFKPLVQFALVSFACASLAVIAESLQAFLPGRTPNLTDVLASSLGGLAGCLVFHLYWFRSLKMAIAGFIGYMVLTFLLSTTIPTTNDFRNWDTTFPLLVGNELTGDRPWVGSVSEIQMFDRAIVQPEIIQLLSRQSLAHNQSFEQSLIAAYQLKGQGNYPDLTGYLPALDWKGEPPETVGTEVALNAQHWLQTTAPATYLTDKIKQTGEFSISFLVASANLSQTGPARIISLSKNLLHRNFTLAQQADALVLRFRTASTGNIGSPELSIPHVFSDTHWHHIIITYQDTIFRVYLDSLENCYTLSLFPVNRMFTYYGLIFIPLGFLLGLINLLSKGKSFSINFSILGSVVLPPLLLEGLLSSTGNRNFRLEDVWLSLLFMVGTWCLVQGVDRLWRKAMPVRKAPDQTI